MTQPIAILPLSEIPFDLVSLEREVEDMERTLDLLKRRDAAALALSSRGLEMTLDQLSPLDIIRMVAKRRSCSIEEIRGRCKIAAIAHGRQEVFYLMSIQVKADGSQRWSLSMIGMKVVPIGAKPFDHTTVLHGIRRHVERLRAAAAGEKPKPVDTGPRPRAKPLSDRQRNAGAVCMIPGHLDCPGCGAPGGEPCRDGATRK